MTKRIGSLLLALIMTISLAVPAMAVTETAQTEDPTASTVESTASTDADTSAPTPEETPDTSEEKRLRQRKLSLRQLFRYSPYNLTWTLILRICP